MMSTLPEISTRGRRCWFIWPNIPPSESPSTGSLSSFRWNSGVAASTPPAGVPVRAAAAHRSEMARQAGHGPCRCPSVPSYHLGRQRPPPPGLTRMHFAAQFRSHRHAAAGHSVLQRQIEARQELLLNPELALVDVALSVGFQTRPIHHGLQALCRRDSASLAPPSARAPCSGIRQRA